MRRLLFVIICSGIFIGAFLSVVNFNRLFESSSRNEAYRGKNEAMDALDFWTRSRAYPDRDIPPDKYYKAYQQSRIKHKELPQIMTAGSIWDPIGPINLQGRCLCAAVNPLNSNTIYVGTASGGLWRSYTSGLSGDWVQIKLGYPALGISAIVIDPVDSNTIYIGTGETYGYQKSNGGVTIRTTRGSYGIGVLKTTDGGTTWTKSLDWSYNQQTGIQMLRLNPHNRHTIWAATTEGLYKSVDDGTTWQNKCNILMGEDILINPLDTNQMIVSFGDLASAGTGVYKSLDGWTTFASITPQSYSGKTRLDEWGTDPNIVYASIADSTTGVG